MNVNLNNLTRADRQTDKKSLKIKNPMEDIIKDSTSKKEIKKHFKDHLPNKTKNEGVKNFHIQQPDKRNGNN